MARPSLQVGGYLLLRPEDAPGTLTRLAYASIVGVARAKVVVKLAEDLSDDGTIELPRLVAELRGIPRSEATGSQLGKWLRQAVWVSAGGSYRYGQVRGYSGSKLDIWTAQGAMSVTRRQLVGEWLQELASDMDVERLATAQVEWVNALSGAQQLVSLRHALIYVLYKELQGQPPHGLLRKIGKSITEEPRSFQAWVGQTSNPDIVDIDHYPSITTREFLASLSEGEESDAEVERARGQQQPTHTPRTPLRTTQRHAPSSGR
ncbi:hypothetical protein PHYSODRAFT_293421 [Phytophthora sojae]|uniref:Uncharacterized protein n=1 Tax=Phytophthora sojae (strain P6497) TaxID=1094619 RepID=G4YFR3_PHYSP|nr:hypothetical protein PHYSODRAFT_293421 [Phytophthora sojae]EGZ27640.1 hypothetical protein PHYSODRAFT_293421 [Phytophthora sojae]|eukprot:XP_009514915.1 hypothetical protein PHYSODRAFT_293421 [Phytophthora sojae]